MDEFEIKTLPSEVVDQIAAGEVVDRPAHLVKELIENSLDAGSSKIEIDIDEGGRRVVVEDNGRGVHSRDLPMVFNRHATSKIEVSDDLWNLSTFGFRGEALASISAVSRTEFVSRRNGSQEAFRIFSEFGKISQVEPTAFAEGTRVEVSDLFANVPARKKFLKSDAAEVTQIKSVIKAVALARPDVQFKLKIKGKLVFLWPSTDSLLERAKKVLEVSNLYRANLNYEDFAVEILFADPGTTARVSRQIWLFVQDRWVQDKTLQAAVMEAYRSLLMHGEYPICVVKLKVRSDLVDVNVHPTKSQVKFVDSKDAFRAVHHCLRQALEQAPWLTIKKPSAPALELRVQEQPENMTFADRSFSKTQFKNKIVRPETRPPIEERIGLQDFAEAKSARNEISPHEEFSQVVNQKPWSRLQVIGQLDLTYIVSQSEDAMVLIDQHAAHERVAFERLVQSFRQGKIEQQSYLLPLHIDLDEPEVEALIRHQDDLQLMGLVIDQAGPTTISVESAPAIISESGIVSALKKLGFEILEKGGSFAFETAINDIFATMACHSVIRAGQALSIPEMEKLLLDMDEFPLSSFCPHGRSVSVSMPFTQLEKDFGRRV